MSIQIPSGSTDPTASPLDPNDPTAGVDQTTFDTTFAPQDTISADGPVAFAPLAASSGTTNSIQSILLNPPRVDLKGYSELLGQTQAEMTKTVNESLYQDQGLYKNFTQSNVITAQYLSSLRSFLVSSTKQWADITNQQNASINTYNAANTAYQTSVNTAQNNMNSAIAAHNAGLMDDATFNANVDTYNTAIANATATFTAATNTYNQETTNINTQIDNLNQQRIALGLPPIPDQVFAPAVPTIPVQAYAPLPLPVPSVAAPVYPPLISNVTGPGSVTDVLDVYYKPVVKQYKKQVKQSNKNIANNILWKDYSDFFLQGELKSIPNAFSFKGPYITTLNDSGGTPAAGSGVSLSLLLLGPQAPAASGSLSTQIWRQQGNTDKEALPPHVFDQLAFEGVSLLARAGLASTSGATRLLIDKVGYIDFRSSPVALALNIGNINQILQIIQGGTTTQLAAALLAKATNGQLDAATLQQLSTLLGSSMNVQMLQFALFQLSVTLGTPGLIPQMLGNVMGTENVQNILNQQSALQAAQNPLALSAAAQASADAIAGDQLQAQQLAADVIQQVLSNQAVTDATLQQDLQAAYIQAGLDQDAAAQASAAFYESLDNEPAASALNSALQENDLNAEAIADQAASAALAQQIQINQQVLEETLAKNFIEADTLRTLRDQRDITAAALQAQGIDRSTALGLANTAIDNVRSQNPSITQPGLTAQLTPEQIAAQLQQLTVDHLKSSIGAAEAQRFGDLLAQAVVGMAGSPNPSPDQLNPIASALYQYQQQQIVLDRIKFDTFFGLVDHTLDQFVNPSLPVLQIVNDNNTLARTYLKTGATGIMYQDSVPLSMTPGVSFAA